MRKLIVTGLVLCMNSVAVYAQPEHGDATYLPPQKVKSDLTRAEVLSKTDSMNIANSLDGTYSPSVASSGVLTRAEVIRKMEGFENVEFGDGTNPQPWVRKNRK